MITVRITRLTAALAGAALIAACGSSASKTATPSSITTSATTEATAAPTHPAPSNTIAIASSATVAPTQEPPPATATLQPAPPPENTQVPPPPVATEAPAPPPPPPPSNGTLTVVALNLAFDLASLSASAGSVTIVFDNQDKAIAHNIHFFSKTSGTSIGETAIKPGVATDTLSLGALAPGAYFYKCDVHPTTMTGTLTVS